MTQMQCCRLGITEIINLPKLVYKDWCLPLQMYGLQCKAVQVIKNQENTAELKETNKAKTTSLIKTLLKLSKGN